jgi:methyl-accepting chemotaxis protein
MQDASPGHDGFLLLGPAAERLGLSRLKLREAIAKGLVAARRDNEGRWRVDLGAVPQDLRERIRATPAAPEALMGALFDEIEELSADLDGARDLSGRLAGLAEAQAGALERSVAALEARTAERDRLAGLAGQALDAAEAAEARAAALQGMTDRALAALERSTGAMEAAVAETARLKAQAAAQSEQISGHAGQLDRLFALSEQALETAAKARAAPSLVARMFGRR